MNIRRANEGEAAALSKLAWEAKAHWGYAPQVMEAWRADLEVTALDIRSNPTFVADLGGEIAGFYLLKPSNRAWRLEHLWLAPEHMSRGLGSALLAHALGTAASGGAGEVAVDADPHAEPFYLARGAMRTGTIFAPTADDPKRSRPQFLVKTGTVRP
jgi:GNAT superfamily N-acetyltransferase